MMKFSSETTKPFVDDYLLSEEVKEAVATITCIFMIKIITRLEPDLRTASAGSHP